MQYFNDMIQDLLNSKIGKAESYLIGAYLNEWLELTYYIETLPWIMIGTQSKIIVKLISLLIFSP